MNQNKGGSAKAETEDTVNIKGKNYFLGIGINEYQKFTKLFNARKDVEDVRALLCNSFNFEEKNSEIVADEYATRRNIIKKINELRSKITPDDSVLIYYSGHGFLDGKLGFWIPADAEQGEMADYISNADVREIIKEIPAKHILLISDSCFAASLLVRNATREISGAFDNWEKNKSRWVFISGKGVVSDGEKNTNSPFAKAILKHLKEEAHEKINIVKLADDVVNSVRFNYEQQAELSPLFGAGHDGGQFVFRKIREEMPDWTTACTKNTAAAYEAFLLKYPNSQFLAEAEKKIIALKDAAAWKLAEQRNSEIAYLDYLRQFAKGTHSAEAKQRMETFGDERFWQQAKRKNSIVAFMEYLEAYPNGKYEAEANAAIAVFEDKHNLAEEKAKQEREALKRQQILKKNEAENRATQAQFAAQQLKQQEKEEHEKAEAMRIANEKEKQRIAEKERLAKAEAAKKQEKAVFTTDSPIIQAETPSFWTKYSFPMIALGLIFLIFLCVKMAFQPNPSSITDSPNNSTQSMSSTQTMSNEQSLDIIKAMEMIAVKGGSFQMGSNENDDEKPIHQVTVADFSIGKYEVTQKQWRAVMGTDPSGFKNCDYCPVENVSWNDIQDFLSKLNAKTPPSGAGGKKYRLPTEAEWEYAARGGNKSKGYTYAGSNTIGDVAQYDGNNNKSTSPVGSKKANELGVFDMSGNVWEWCQDWYGEKYYSSSSKNNPTGPSSGATRVYRGGSWYDYSVLCRVADRGNGTPEYRFNLLGIRLVLSVQ